MFYFEGADINFPDRHGQTCLHEIVRGWHTDVAQFALSRGADINRGDKYGRTPLHLASAINYAEMVFWLITNGGKYDLYKHYYIYLVKLKQLRFTGKGESRTEISAQKMYKKS